MEQEQELLIEAEPVTIEMEPAATGGKCEHGNYICAGESAARHCSGCNPDANADRVHSMAMNRKKPACRIYGEGSTLSAADFLDQPIGTRLAETAGMSWE